jgi:hypothetical protein
MTDTLFPRNLYISPGKIKTNNEKTYDTVLVENDTEMKAAMKSGYIDSYYDALNKKVKKTKSVAPTEKVDTTFEDDDF